MVALPAAPAVAQDCTNGMVNPMGGGTPIGSEAGYTIYTPGDGVFGNSELEGTIAVGGTATFSAAGGGSGSYAIFHGGVGGNADYDVPIIDGDLNRVLMTQFGLPAPDAPQRVAQVQVRVDGTPAAGVKIVEQDAPADYEVMAAYDSSGSTYSLSQSAGGTNQSPQISSTPQLWDGGAGAASWSTSQSFTEYFPADTGASILANAAYVAPTDIAVGSEAAITLDPTGPNLMSLAEFGTAAKFTMTRYSEQSPLVVRPTPADVVDGVLQLPSYAYPGKDAPNNAGIEYLLFDLSAVSEDVVITSRGGEPVRGSIYAPDAHVIFPPEPQGGVEFEGQVIAGDFTALQGGKEIHTNLFAGVFPCGADPVGGFSLQKTLSGGISTADFPAGTEFDVTASWTIDGVGFDETYAVPVDGTVVAGPQDLPEGTVVSFSESGVPEAPGWAFQEATFSPESVTIGAGGNTLVTATNVYSRVGGFSVQKQVDGVPPEDIPAGTMFRVLAVWVEDGTPHLERFDLAPDGTVVQGPQDIPVGTTVTFLEPRRVSIDGYVFQDVTFSARQITVGQGENPVITATNAYAPDAPDVGGFALHKQLGGIDPTAFPDGTTFQVTASWEVGGVPASQVFELPADGTEVLGPQDLPVGTVVTFEETDPGQLTPAEYTLDDWGVSPSSITIADGEDPQITATNVYTSAAPVGGFELQKRLSPDGVITDADFPPGTTFPVYSVRFADGAPIVEEWDLPADGSTVQGPTDLPAGSRVAFFEPDAPDAPAGFVYDGVTFDQDGVTLNPAVITIGDGTNPTITATNTYRPVGGFSLSKTLAGIDAGEFPPSTTFTVVAWTRIDGSFEYRSFALPVDGTVVEGPQDLPAGTTVHFLEVEQPVVPGFEFTEVSFSPSTIVIGQGGEQTVTATNAYRELLGGFTVHKTIEGSGASVVPPGTTFDVRYFYDGEPAGTLAVPATGETVQGPQNIRAGTVVTFEEAEPLPGIPGAVWTSATFDPSEIVIADGADADVTLTNSIRLLAGGFSIQKEIAGTGAYLVSPDTTFKVAYYLDGSVTAAGTLSVDAAGTVVDGPQDLPVGTVVTFREVSTPQDIAEGRWSGTPTFSPARIVIADQQNIAVTVTNTFTAYPLAHTGTPWVLDALALGALAAAMGSALIWAARRRHQVGRRLS
jgi:choice-of-anchor A domain-containing protein